LSGSRRLSGGGAEGAVCKAKQIMSRPSDRFTVVFSMKLHQSECPVHGGTRHPSQPTTQRPHLYCNIRDFPAMGQRTRLQRKEKQCRTPSDPERNEGTHYPHCTRECASGAPLKLRYVTGGE
jgi:hypothetical protein